MNNNSVLVFIDGNECDSEVTKTTEFTVSTDANTDAFLKMLLKVYKEAGYCNRVEVTVKNSYMGDTLIVIDPVNSGGIVEVTKLERDELLSEEEEV